MRLDLTSIGFYMLGVHSTGYQPTTGRVVTGAVPGAEAEWRLEVFHG